MGTLCEVIIMVLVLLCNLPLETAADTQDCTSEVVQLYPCLAFVSQQVPTLSRNCCDALDNVVTKTPVCLCELIARGKNGTANTGLPTVNLTLVRELPKDCGIYPEVQADESQCQVRGALAPNPFGPTGSPGLATLVPPFSLLLWALTSTVPLLTWECSPFHIP